MRILVIRGGALGDFLVTLPTLRSLREQWPEAHIEVLGHPHLVQIAVNRYYVNAARSVDHRALSAFFTPRAVLDPDWMEYIGRFDLVLSYFYDPDELFLQNLKRCDPGRIVTLSPKVPEDFTEPAALYLGKILEALGLSVGSAYCPVYPTAEDRAQAGKIRSTLAADRRWIMVHPSSGGLQKNWPPERWVLWGQQLLAKRFDLGLLVLEGEADEAVANTVTQGWSDLPFSRLRNVSTPVLAALFQETPLYLGHDSGITHLAAGSNESLAILALFGPTSARVWAPPRSGVEVLQKSTHLLALSVEQVLQRTLALLDQNQALA